ncbi:MAG: hypothetical protein QG552_345 [Thermodesulfobacteriota bacterium]|nr:hypothetical protein [Thermodesulfobacteriota bacterium]
MSNQNAKGKLKYASPIIVPLGSMAKGSGACTTGSGYTGTCVYAPGADAPYDTTACGPGALPADYCSAGTTATALSASYCSSSGVTASDYCTAGTCAPGPAAYCSSSGVEAGKACGAGTTPNTNTG